MTDSWRIATSLRTRLRLLERDSKSIGGNWPPGDDRYATYGWRSDRHGGDTKTEKVSQDPALGLTLALPDNGSAAAGTSQRVAFDTISSAFGPGYNGPLPVLASLNPAANPAAAAQHADAVAAKLNGFADVAAVTQPQLDQAHTAALIEVVPASAPSAAATARLSAALLPFAGIVVGLSLLLLMLVFRSLIVPVKAAIGFLLSVGASFGATAAVFQWGWLAGPLGVTTGPVASFLPIVLMAVLFGLAMDYEVFLASRIRENYTRTGDPRHVIIAGGGGAARVMAAAAVIMTSIFASFLLSGDTTIKSLALALAVGVACDALLVRMTIVPAVLTLAGTHAWYLPRWLNRILPDLDIEGTTLPRQPTPSAAAGERARAKRHEAAERTCPPVRHN
jgi:putative drug exporter of the RND superfamily